ncbi:PREDICTED: protein cramped-like [Trachymyrmex cornetzi]|uniref:Protein cramped-like protein n=1 Tax=Trachymyrmex cornetzi TaxID=471704 RepID=A0A151JT12_9HYME|nr:PREDICTED: protein cramped-like [Trachymyrmex cornetzi]XP_018378587.1 PREDICTED: protein cramped-like [Trachymyrmex cornetzi]XP_018378594.1 PREDICTED: protein cramped-like [Trachymyrmex cornetzi]XP_018378599.1 PREDICTED: protein cramped-like [Trachymyrmex cornetzi]KYN30291.1 Protein cramped-like protein [Trachymyrmex cornetzi]
MTEDPTKCEDTDFGNVTPVCSQVNQIYLDAKCLIDSKNTQVRVVRGAKKFKIDNDVNSTEKKDAKEEETAEVKVKSLKRSCELWSMEDKNTFFKALNEYGKDFDALQSYFLNQGKKRGLSDIMIKNKEQIRHFYYRTWLKISKHLKFSEDVKKTSQELYGLINYGELRRKLPRIHEKVHLRLNELVYWGSTQVRLRGKTMRVKTPICRALRKLNQLEDWQEEIKLPSRIVIELRPRNNMAWWQVQAASMNPRVRTLLPIQRRLSSLLIFLQQRWRLAKYTTCSTVENLVANDIKDTCLLRVAPPEGCKIALPMVNLGEYLTSNSVSLNSYEKRLGLKSSREDLLGSVQYLKGVGKKGIKRYKSDKKILNRTDENCTLPDISSDMDLLETGSNISEKPAIINNTEKPPSEHHSEPNRFPGRETIERIRKGWNVEEANTITVGDLFLMFGRESKIILEYWWDWLPNGQYTTNSASSSIMHDNSICLVLQKLLSLAKHNYGTNKVYDNTSGSNETVISSRVLSIKESTFRRPLIPQTYHKIGTADAFKTQLDKFKTRFCKRGRTVRQKSLVIQRVLPVVSAPNMSSENLTTNASVCQMQTNKITVNANDAQDKTFLDALETSGDTKNSNSIITSATQILKEGEHQWLNSEVADFSLSSFLGQLESPMKGSQRSQAGEQIMEDTRPSSDVVSHMQCLMGENSVDYMAKFANLASQMACDENKK